MEEVAALKEAFSGVPAIALDPLRANVLYVGSYREGLMTSADGGRTWSLPGLRAASGCLTSGRCTRGSRVSALSGVVRRRRTSSQRRRGRRRSPGHATVARAVDIDGLCSRHDSLTVGSDRPQCDAGQTGRPPGHALIVGAKHPGTVGARIHTTIGTRKTPSVAAPHLHRRIGIWRFP